MSGSWLGVVIELIVAGLLATTIGYCVILNRRLTRLRADEGAMREMVGELVAATGMAERAIAGLRQTAHEADVNLSDRLRSAERMTGELDKQLRAGRDVIDRIVQIAGAARPPAIHRPEAAQPAPVARIDGGSAAGFAGEGVAAFRAAAEAPARRIEATASAAHALAERARLRAAG